MIVYPELLSICIQCCPMHMSQAVCQILNHLYMCPCMSRSSRPVASACLFALTNCFSSGTQGDMWLLRACMNSLTLQLRECFCQSHRDVEQPVTVISLYLVMLDVSM